MNQQQQPTVTIIKEQFWYNAIFGSLAPAASSTVQVQIQADADFDIIKQTRVAIASNVETSTVNMTILLTDTGSGRQMMDQATHVDNIFGTAQFPYILPQAKRLSANSTFQVQVSNIDSAVTYQASYFTFHGPKIYIFKPNQPR